MKQILVKASAVQNRIIIQFPIHDWIAIWNSSERAKFKNGSLCPINTLTQSAFSQRYDSFLPQHQQALNDASTCVTCALCPH
jgi:hypothetical protein